ncbi:MAG: CCDC90 family protein [Magnetococcus sp. YQC-3]
MLLIEPSHHAAVAPRCISLYQPAPGAVQWGCVQPGGESHHEHDAFAVPFDTLAFVKKLESAGVPSPQAEAQAEALTGVLQKVEESRMQELASKELATKGDILRLEKEIELAKTELRKDIETTKAEFRKDIETAKVETIKWVIVTGIAILGGVAAINRMFPPVPAYYQPPAQEMRQTAPPPALPVPPAAPTPAQPAR